MDYLSDYCHHFESKDWFANCFAIFDELRRQKKFCDISVKLENKSFMAHRNVLSATIPYFNAMLTNGWNESKQTELVIPYSEDTIEASAMESLLEFVYTGQIMITTSNVRSILKGASYLQLDVVRDVCCQFIKLRLNANNVFDNKSFADTLGCHSLVAASKVFIQKHFKEVSKSEKFLSLDFCEIIDIIAKDELNVSGEEDVFQAVMAWIKRDVNQRKSKLDQLLTNVRLPLLSQEFLIKYVMKEELIRSSNSCHDIVNDPKRYQNLGNRLFLPSSVISPRYNDIQGTIYVAGVLKNCVDPLLIVEVFNPQIGSWKLHGARKASRTNFEVVVMNDKLYTIGGYSNDSDSILTTVEVFDPKDKSWSEVSPMNYKRRYFGAVGLNTTIYVCGGDSYDELDFGFLSLRSVECYNLEKNEWSVIEPMSGSRAGASVVACDGQIYVLGGEDSNLVLDSVEMFEPQTGKWKIMSPMLTKRRHFGVATLKAKIYVCGGCDGSNNLQTAEVYDPNTQKWNFIAPMNQKRNCVSLVANCGLLYAIGGYHNFPLNTVEVYDPDKNRWEFMASLVALERNVAAVVVPN